MIYIFVIILLIIICLFVFRKTKKDIPNIISGKRVKGFGLATKMDYPTINLLLDSPTNCGFYRGTYNQSSVIIIVDHTKKFAECHFKGYDNKLDGIQYFQFINIKKVEAPNDAGFLGTYMRGC